MLLPSCPLFVTHLYLISSRIMETSKDFKVVLLGEGMYCIEDLKLGRIGRRFWCQKLPRDFFLPMGKKDHWDIPFPSTDTDHSLIPQRKFSGSVGKTSLFTRFMLGDFDENHISTLQAMSKNKRLNLPDGRRANIALWVRYCDWFAFLQDVSRGS